jgi:hypothetical protein
MKLTVNVLETFPVEVGVELRGHDGGVAEHLLHGAQVGPAGQEMGRERVA